MRNSAFKGVLNALASPAWRKQLVNGRMNPVPAEMAANQTSDALAMDASGRLYFVRIDESYLPVLYWSDDKGESWSQPLRLNPPEVVQSVLPSIAVTPNGRVGLAYYGSMDKQTWHRLPRDQRRPGSLLADVRNRLRHTPGATPDA